MPSERVSDDACGISRRWAVDLGLAEMVVALDQRATERFSSQGLRFPGTFIISGYRPRSLQAQINPAVPDSLHTRCPALAVDLRVGNFAASTTPASIWSVLGRIWKELGGSWGGDFSPPDLNHFACRGCGAPFRVPRFR